jgi:hypothetical protein
VASQTPPNILVVNQTLPDLPATMVIKTIKGRTPDVVTLIFSPPGEGTTGEVKMVDQSKLLTLIPSFAAPDQLVGSLQGGARGPAPEGARAPLPAELPQAAPRVPAEVPMRSSSGSRRRSGNYFGSPLSSTPM